MDFAISPEQTALQDTVRKFLDQKSPETEVRRLMATTTGYDADVWKQMAQQLGLHGMIIPEKFGGSGFGYLELSIILEEMGRSLLCAPFFSTVALAATALLDSADESACATYLPQIASGDLIATVAIPAGAPNDAPTVTATPQSDGYVLDGVVEYVLDGHTAELIVVPAIIEGDDQLSMFVVSPVGSLPSQAMRRQPLSSIDETRKLARLEFDQTPASILGSPGSGRAVLDSVLVKAAVALAAEQVGVCQWGLSESVEYAKLRIQFGRPIGSFQAIKHKCVDMLVHLESAKAVAYYAAWAVATNAPDLLEIGSLAKAECSEAALEVAAETIQVHGGIGFTWEHPAQLYFKRAKNSELFLGTPDYHRELICEGLTASA